MFPLVVLAPVAMTAIEAFSAGVGIGIALHKAVKSSDHKDTDQKEGDK